MSDEEDIFSISSAFGPVVDLQALNVSLDTYHGDEEEKSNQKPSQDMYLQMVCNANGLNPSEDLAQIELIEVFQVTSFKRIAGLNKFINIRHLEIMQQPYVRKMEGLSSLINLHSLWLTDNNIDKLEGLSELVQLRELHVDANNIKKLEGLETLIHLETLYANNNQITALEGLSNLTELSTLNLASNKLEFIGTRLNHLTKLTDLNLSNNRIGSFSEIRNLSGLRSLKKMALNDAHYGDNPVCNLCNYYTYALYHLHFLSCLDSIQVTKEAVVLAEATYLKKQLFYNMRIKMCKRSTSNLIRAIGEKIKLEDQSRKKKERHLMLLSKSVERELQGCPGMISECKLNKDQLAKCKSAIKKAGEILVIENKKRKQKFKEFEANISRTSEQLISRMILEMEVGGNIRYEDGDMKNQWYVTSTKFAKSRIRLSSFHRSIGINAVRIRRVTKLHNRFLRNRFDQKLESIEKFAPRNPERENPELHFMFCSFNDVASTDRINIIPLLDLGFSTPEQVSPSNLESPARQSIKKFEKRISIREKNVNSGHSVTTKNLPVELFTHIGNGDEDVLQNQTAGHEGYEGLGSRVIGTSKILIVKAYSGTSIEKDTTIQCAVTRDNFPQYDSVMEIIQKSASEMGKLNGDITTEKSVSSINLNNNTQDASRKSEINEQEKEKLSIKSPSIPSKICYLFDQGLLMPEYLMTIDYIYENPMSSEKLISMETLDSDLVQLAGTFVGLLSPVLQFYSSWDIGNFNPVEEVIEAVPEIPLPSFNSLDENGHARVFVSDAHADTIEYISFHGMSLKSIPEGLSQFKNLKTLILSFNNLTEFPDISCFPSLETLELSHNSCEVIPPLKTHETLKSLAIDNNKFISLQAIRSLAILAPNLKSLDFRGNPLIATPINNIKVTRIKKKLLEPSAYFSTIRSSFIHLETLDGMSIENQEKKYAEVSDITVITEKMLLEHAFVSKSCDTLENKRNMLDSQWVSSSVAARLPLHSFMKEKPDSFKQSESWKQFVIELELDHLRIQEITGLDSFTALTKVSFCDNRIDHIHGFSECASLRAIILESNHITEIDNLTNLTLLTKLDLGRNYICQIQGLHTLQNLSQLCLEDNRISSLAGLEKLTRLTELYIGNNKIEKLDETTHLKELPKLMILDLSGNGLCSDPEYRLHTIYYLKKLKMLDGFPVEISEYQNAKEVYTGKLTEDMLYHVLQSKPFALVERLDLSGIKIKFADIVNVDRFPNLRALILDRNYISDISHLGSLPYLRVLRLNKNKISSCPTFDANCGYLAHCFPRLEILELGSNRIQSIAALNLHGLRQLKVLTLEDNEISRIDGLNDLRSLQQLVLAKNKIKRFEPDSFTGLRNLRGLQLEENGLRFLSNFGYFPNLKTLFLAYNRIMELGDLENLVSNESDHSTLTEITLKNNPVSRKHLYQLTLIHLFPSINMIDGQKVTDEQREKSVQVFQPNETQQSYLYTEHRANDRMPLRVQSFAMPGLNITDPFLVGNQPSSNMPMQQYAINNIKSSNSIHPAYSNQVAGHNYQSYAKNNNGYQYSNSPFVISSNTANNINLGRSYQLSQAGMQSNQSFGRSLPPNNNFQQQYYSTHGVNQKSRTDSKVSISNNLWQPGAVRGKKSQSKSRYAGSSRPSRDMLSMQFPLSSVRGRHSRQ